MSDKLMDEILTTVAKGYDSVRPGAGDCVREQMSQGIAHYKVISGRSKVYNESGEQIASADTEGDASRIVVALREHKTDKAKIAALVAAGDQMMKALRRARDEKPERWDDLVTPDICSAWTELSAALKPATDA